MCSLQLDYKFSNIETVSSTLSYLYPSLFPPLVPFPFKVHPISQSLLITTTITTIIKANIYDSFHSVGTLLNALQTFCLILITIP